MATEDDLQAHLDSVRKARGWINMFVDLTQLSLVTLTILYLAWNRYKTGHRIAKVIKV